MTPELVKAIAAALPGTLLAIAALLHSLTRAPKRGAVRQPPTRSKAGQPGKR